MNWRSLWKRLFVILITVFVVFSFTACEALVDAMGGGDDEEEEDTTITAAQLAGSWLKAGSFTYDTDKTAEAATVDIAGNAITVIYYKDSEQVFGITGTFTMNGTNMLVATTSEWNSTTFWQAKTGTKTIPITMESASVFSFTPPDTPAPVQVTKTAFSSSASLVGTWSTADKSETFVINADGTYSYTSTTNDPETGNACTASGTTTGYFRNVTLKRDEGSGFVDKNIAYLTPYKIVSGNLVFTYPGPVDVTFLPDTGGDQPQGPLAGSWLKVFDAPYNKGTTETPEIIDAMTIDVDGTAMKVIFYFETEQVFGIDGTFTTSVGNISYTITHKWSLETKDWAQVPSAENIPYTATDTALTITLPDQTVPVELTKAVFNRDNTNFADSVWYLESGEETAALMKLAANGMFAYMDNEPYSEFGEHWSASGITEGYLRIVATVVDGEEDKNKSSLTPYRIETGNLIMTYGGGDKTYINDTANYIPSDQLYGTWMEEFDTPYTYDSDGETPDADAVTLLFMSESPYGKDGYEAIFYADVPDTPGTKEQVSGTRGRFINFGSRMVLWPILEWDYGSKQWDSTESEVILTTNNRGDGFYTIAGPDGDMVMSSVTFSQPEELIDSWGFDTGDGWITLQLNGYDDDFSYSYDDESESYQESGNWSATGTSGYLRLRTTGRSTNIDPVDIMYLNEFEYSDGVLTASEEVFTRPQ